MMLQLVLWNIVCHCVANGQPVDFLLWIDAAEDVSVSFNHRENVHRVEPNVSINEHHVCGIGLQESQRQRISCALNQRLIEHERKAQVHAALLASCL